MDPRQRSKMGEVAPAGQLTWPGYGPQEMQRYKLGWARSWLCRGVGEGLGVENYPLVRSLLRWEPRSLSGKERRCHSSRKDLGETAGGADDGGSGRMRCLFLDCFPGGWGKVIPPSPSGRELFCSKAREIDRMTRGTK